MPNRTAAHNRILFDYDSIIDYKLSIINYWKDASATIRIDGINSIHIKEPMDQYKWIRMFGSKDVLEHATAFKSDASNVKNVYTYYCEEKNKSLLLLYSDYAVCTSMVDLINNFKHAGSGIIVPTVLCSDVLEQQIIKKILPDTITLVLPRHDVETNDYGRIVLGYPNHALEFNNPATQDFMILNFRENFSKEDPTLLPSKVLIDLGDVNTFTIAKAYSNIEDPQG